MVRAPEASLREGGRKGGREEGGREGGREGCVSSDKIHKTMTLDRQN